jgi:heme-degrading monooxygenase HmoA
MYVRVTPFSFDPAKEQEIVRFTDERLMPAIRQLPGFRRYTGALDRAHGRGFAISEWDTLEQAEQFRTALGSLVQQIAELSVRLEAGQTLEVVVQA